MNRCAQARIIKASHILLALLCCIASSVKSQTAQEALTNAVSQTPADAVVMDIATGRVLAVANGREAMQARILPGSTLKPFFLAYGLEHKQIAASDTIFCRRHLRIAGRDVSCTHPQTEAAFNAEDALAYSCNQYFVELARRLAPEDAAAVLRQFKLTYVPHTTEEIELTVLGLSHVQITPFQLAEAYRQFALQITNHPGDSSLEVVKRGLEDSVQFGMAHNADTPGLSVAGKTGTASNPEQAWTHGVFAGYAPSSTPRVAIVIYLPRGNGGDAAHLAQQFFQAYKGRLSP